MWEAITIYAVILIWMWPQGEATDFSELRGYWRREFRFMALLAAPLLGVGAFYLWAAFGPSFETTYETLGFLMLAWSVVYFIAHWRNARQRNQQSARSSQPTV
jgi:nitrate/nitrite transporter NarK